MVPRPQGLYPLRPTPTRVPTQSRGRHRQIVLRRRPLRNPLKSRPCETTAREPTIPWLGSGSSVRGPRGSRLCGTRDETVVTVRTWSGSPSHLLCVKIGVRRRPAPTRLYRLWDPPYTSSPVLRVPSGTPRNVSSLWVRRGPSYSYQDGRRT